MRNFSEREVIGYFNPKSLYTLVGKPLLRRLVCKQDYRVVDLIFERGNEYVVWIASCFHSKSPQNVFYHMVAPAGIGESEPAFRVVPLETFGEYDKGEIDLIVNLDGDEYKLVKEFNGNHILIPRWRQYRDKMMKFVIEQLGEGDYVICGRIFGHKDDANDSFIGWEILQRKKTYNQVKIFNLFSGEFVSMAAVYSDVYPLGNNQKAVKKAGMEIKYSKCKLQILLNPDKKKKAPRVPKTAK